MSAQGTNALTGLCLLLLLALSSLGARAEDLPALVERTKPSIVGVGSAYPPRQPQRKDLRQKYLGTGFVVGNGLQVITNAHVIPESLDSDNGQVLAVFVGKGGDASARVARLAQLDAAHDLALLEIRGEPLPALPIGNSDAVREGQSVVFSGYPLGMALGLYPVTHRGIVSAITPMAQPAYRAGELTSSHIKRMRSQFMAFQLDATAYPGNSGSPVMDPSSGEVIGVLNSVLVKETRENMLASPSGISYAIPARHVAALLRRR